MLSAYTFKGGRSGVLRRICNLPRTPRRIAGPFRCPKPVILKGMQSIIDSTFLECLLCRTAGAISGCLPRTNCARWILAIVSALPSLRHRKVQQMI